MITWFWTPWTSPLILPRFRLRLFVTETMASGLMGSFGVLYHLKPLSLGFVSSIPTEAKPKRAETACASFAAISGTGNWSINNPSVLRPKEAWSTAWYWRRENRSGWRWARSAFGVLIFLLSGNPARSCRNRSLLAIRPFDSAGPP